MGPLYTHTRKTIVAGSIVVQALYPRRCRGDSDKARAAKSKATSEAQRRLNLEHSWQKLELLLAANFPTAGSGLVIELTYDDAHLPQNREQARRKLKHFLKRLREERKAAGLPAPRVVHNIEALSSQSGRWHHHIVLDNTGQDLEIVRRCWIYGSDIECKKLRVDREKNHETLAKYMSKEPRECQDETSRPGLHAWSYTRNCLKPTVETEPVEADANIDPPEGVTVLSDEQRATEYANWRVVKYRVDNGCFARPPRARRRRRVRTFL